MSQDIPPVSPDPDVPPPVSPPAAEAAPSPPAAGPTVAYARPSTRAPDGSYIGPPANPDDRTMGMLCHLLGVFTMFLGPLIIWLIKKDQSPFIDDQGKEALNFQILATIAVFACVFVLCIPIVGLLLFAGVHVTRIVFGIMGTIAANKGEAYRYPFTLRLIK